MNFQSLLDKYRQNAFSERGKGDVFERFMQAYLINCNSAIEWIMERYQITVHKESQIRNDPNNWATEHDKPSYIFDLLQSVISLSLQTVEIVEGLPVGKF